MTILYDHQTFSLQEYGGISRYFSELIHGINNNTQHKASLSLKYTNNVYAHDLHIAKQQFLPTTRFPKKMPILYRLNKANSIVDLLTKSYDLVHATYYDPYFFHYTRKRPTVVTFLDMIHERFAVQFSELSADRVITARKKSVAKHATHIIAISESTKRDIVDLFGTDPEKISVIHLGSSLALSSYKSTFIDKSTVRPYILFVGHRGHYKNFTLFVKAIATLLHQYGLQLICAGGGSFTKEENTLISSLRLSDTVSQKPVNDESLRTLYSDAILFAFPSLYEGFGLPILEAFSCNCPCAISNQSSLPEVAGEAALYFDPTDADSIRSCIDQLLSDKGLRETLILKGRQQLSLFSWKHTVRETVKVYENLIA